jgi:TRAP-type C4-dicarboxylate transport system permease small subunit
MSAIIRLLDRLLTRIEGVLAVIGAVLLFVIMAIVASDVVMRYLFNRPYSWSYDLISLYLMAGVFYAMLSRTFAIHGHIGVDILQGRMSPSGRRLCHVAIGGIACVLFATIAYVMTTRAIDDWQTDAVAAGAIPWPSWLADAIVPLGAGLLAVRCLVHALAHASVLFGGPEILELPTRSGGGE